MLLFFLVAGAFAWMHLAIRHMERSAGRTGALPDLPEMQGMGEPAVTHPGGAGPLEVWRPEDPAG